MENNIQNHYQQHWFSAGLEKFKIEDRSREEKIEITRHEFKRYIQQITRSEIGKPNTIINLNNRTSNQNNHIAKSEYQHHYNLVSPKVCEIKQCHRPALPCTKQCILHIMFNTEQVLFEYCTAKFSDNTQCSTPVLDILHELPLCTEHARKRDNYKMLQEGKPKKLKKKVKVSAMIRPQKRSKKRKRIASKYDSHNLHTNFLETTKSSTSDVEEITEVDSSNLEVEDIPIVDQVLDLNGNGLQAQPHLLEETDISTVLNTIQDEEFNDFFTVNRNGEYEPTREETEELEKALAAVDNDVKSLEKLSQTHGLLDSLLDENTIGATLVQMPEMFHNGYTTCSGSAVPHSSYHLLSVEHQSHS